MGWAAAQLLWQLHDQLYNRYWRVTSKPTSNTSHNIHSLTHDVSSSGHINTNKSRLTECQKLHILSGLLVIILKYKHPKSKNTSLTLDPQLQRRLTSPQWIILTVSCTFAGRTASSSLTYHTPGCCTGRSSPSARKDPRGATPSTWVSPSLSLWKYWFPDQVLLLYTSTLLHYFLGLTAVLILHQSYDQHIKYDITEL